MKQGALLRAPGDPGDPGVCDWTAPPTVLSSQGSAQDNLWRS